ncbi:cyclin-H1-1 isoform X1 [Silene latifolia]|uniref:cyclin-H1-1 isoform X1 n=2 Tax=Silene latifolia TaxID=37657 RepID=UPI003D76C0EB
MADFQTSTHRTKWIFTQQQLMDKYKVANKRAAQSLKKYGTASLEIDADGSFSHPKRKRDSENNGDKHSSVKPLKVEDERMLHAFYENKIQEVCRAFFFPHKIQGTALIYYKRFYLHWSVMEHDPKYVMLTCVYLACKIEENHVSSEDLGKIIQLDHQLILDNEMLVLQSLGFDLIVYTPYRSIEGFIDDMEDFCYSTGGQMDLLKDLHQKSFLEADKAMLTDAPLLLPPGQLALAALRRANNELGVLDFERYLQSIFSRQHSTHTLSELNQAFDAFDYLITTKTCDGEEMKRAAKKLKSCQDVGSHDGKKREKKSKRRSHKTSQDIQSMPSAATE